MVVEEPDAVGLAGVDVEAYVWCEKGVRDMDFAPDDGRPTPPPRLAEPPPPSTTTGASPRRSCGATIALNRSSNGVWWDLPSARPRVLLFATRWRARCFCTIRPVGTGRKGVRGTMLSVEVRVLDIIMGEALRIAPGGKSMGWWKSMGWCSIEKRQLR